MGAWNMRGWPRDKWSREDSKGEDPGQKRSPVVKGPVTQAQAEGEGTRGSPVS